MDCQPTPQVFVATPAAERASLDYLLSTLPGARAAMPTDEFRAELRQVLLDHPGLTLRQVAKALGVSRQAVHAMVGKLNRPTCCSQPDRPAPKKAAAARHMVALTERIRRGEAAAAVAKELGVSLPMAMKLGLRARALRPNHGTAARAATCNCWRCRRAAGVARPRGRKSNEAQHALVRDWLAWRNPDTDTPLTQTVIGRLTGVAQPMVSRIARGL